MATLWTVQSLMVVSLCCRHGSTLVHTRRWLPELLRWWQEHHTDRKSGRQWDSEPGYQQHGDHDRSRVWSSTSLRFIFPSLPFLPPFSSSPHFLLDLSICFTESVCSVWHFLCVGQKYTNTHIHTHNITVKIFQQHLGAQSTFGSNRLWPLTSDHPLVF